MQRNEFKTYIRYLIYLLEIVFAYSLEQALNVCLPIQIFILIPTFISISLLETEWIGFIFGIMSGLLTDNSFGIGVGFCTVLFGVLGYVFGVLSNYFISANVFTCSVFSLLLSAGVYIVNMMIKFGVGNFCTNIMSKDTFLTFGYSIISFIVVFYVNRAISYKVGGEEESIN